MDKEREKLIGSRLRVFRETLQIPRTKFAVTIGFGGERIASYEAGRVPLPYDVARSVMKHYQISPLWLAKGEGRPRFLNPFDDCAIVGLIKPRMLFSQVYDLHLASDIEKRKTDVEKRMIEAMDKVIVFLEKLDDETIPVSVRKHFGSMLRPKLQKFISIVEWDLPFANAVNKKIEIDLFTPCSNSDGVKSAIAKLILRLKRVTATPGKKAELARFMAVAPARVTEWLSGQEPGGENALQLLHWVEQQERQK
jgi:DNA-binding transcriptional regulator YiaG